jgi:c-di-GMP-related signal transduction protein
MIGGRPPTGDLERDRIETPASAPETPSETGGAEGEDPGSTVLLARQPIFDRNLKVWGYELLYRSGLANHHDASGAPGQATAKVIVNYLLDTRLDSLVGSALAFINVDRETLLGGNLTTLPRNKVVLEILETVEPDAEVVQACTELKSKGFVLALDDVDHQLQPGPLLDLASLIKVDFQKTTPTWREELVNRYGRGGTTMLAEKVESEEEFQQAVSYGYQYFQGYFFKRPAIVFGRPLPVATLALLQILGELASPEVSVNRLEVMVKQQVSLSYKLIRYINSGAFAWRGSIQSLRHALALMGLDRLRKLLSLMVLADVSGKGPRELLLTALMRARMSEILGPSFGLEGREASLFLMGLFSLLGAILRRPLEQILNELNLEQDVSDALLGRSPSDHPLTRLFAFVTAFESGNWTSLATAENARIDLRCLAQGHIQSLLWAEEIAGV